MGTRKNLPTKLTVKQEQQRQLTINKVLRAIEDVKAEGRPATITKLVEFTGLSRSVFAKPHIRELLVDYGYGGKGDGEVAPKKKTKSETRKDQIIAELRAKNAELERECALLRGRLVLLTSIFDINV